MFENCLAWQRLTCALARGAHYIRRPPALQHKKPAKEAIFPGSFYVFVTSIRACPWQEIPMLQTLSARAVLFLCAMIATSIASAAESKSRAGEPEFRELYKELVETNTALSDGSCTLAAERMAARLKSVGLEQVQVFTAPDHPREGGLFAV